MAMIHIILQGKGGVGKSLIASLLAQYLQAKDLTVYCFDTDPVNATLAGYEALDAVALDIMSGDDIDPRRFDQLMDAIIELPADAHVVVDNGASSFVPLGSYLLENQALEVLEEHGHSVMLHTVVTGGQAILDTLSGLKSLVSHFPSTPIVVWLNRYFGDITLDGKRFEEFKIYAECASAFSNEMDAQKVEEVLPKRLGRFGLAVHPEKTRLIRFLPPGGGSGGSGHPRLSFDLLGFTHYWGKSLKGNWVVKRKTAKDRLARALKAVGEWCRINRHNDVADQYRTLVLKIKGHYQYYGITCNARRLNAFREGARRLWWMWLNRRSQRSNMSWQNFDLMRKTYPLPFAVVVHSIYRRAARP
jgi:hypothetical protein